MGKSTCIACKGKYKGEKGVRIHQRSCPALRTVCYKGGYRARGISHRIATGRQAFKALKNIAGVGSKVVQDSTRLLEETLGDGKVIVQDIGGLAPQLYQLGELVKKTVGRGITPFPDTGNSVPVQATCNGLLQICRAHGIRLERDVGKAIRFHARGGIIGTIAASILPAVIPFVAKKLFKKVGFGIGAIENEQLVGQWF